MCCSYMGSAVTSLQDYAHITLWALLGIMVGRTADALLGVIRSQLDWSMKTWPKFLAKWLNVFVQMLILSFIPIFFRVVRLRPFVEDWQTSTHGLFFASFLLGMQSNLLSTIQT